MRHHSWVVVALLLLPAAPALAASPIDELRALHEKVMRAHRTSDIELLLEDEAPDYVVANRGEISRPTIEQRRERLGGYLKSSSFLEYKDLVEPIVSVSTDSTLGWVVVQVGAKGTQQNGKGKRVPIEFVSAWIELYERRDGRWWRTGNVSNFKP
jgi:hypothetical protein